MSKGACLTTLHGMVKKVETGRARLPLKRHSGVSPSLGCPGAPSAAKPSSLVDTRVIWCGDCLEQLKKLPDACVDLIYIDPPFNSNRNYEVFWGETKEKRVFEDRHAKSEKQD